MSDPADPGTRPPKRPVSARQVPAAAPDGPFRDGPFLDGKDAGALRTIGEVARALGLRQHVLRYWEEQFPMLRPLTRAGGRRYYRPADIALLRRIDRLIHTQGYTIRGARLALKEPEEAAVVDLSDTGEPEAAIVAAMAALRAHLAAIHARLANALADS
jgi:DNA-binding transcriptional MerR regulator